MIKKVLLNSLIVLYSLYNYCAIETRKDDQKKKFSKKEQVFFSQYNTCGYYPIHEIAMHTQGLDEFKKLLSCFSIEKLNQKSEYNKIKGICFADTIIHLLVYRKRFDLISAAITFGADHTIINDQGMKPLDYVKEQKELKSFQDAVVSGLALRKKGDFYKNVGVQADAQEDLRFSFSVIACEDKACMTDLVNPPAYKDLPPPYHAIKKYLDPKAPMFVSSNRR